MQKTIHITIDAQWLEAIVFIQSRQGVWRIGVPYPHPVVISARVSSTATCHIASTSASSRW